MATSMNNNMQATSQFQVQLVAFTPGIGRQYIQPYVLVFVFDSSPLLYQKPHQLLALGDEKPVENSRKLVHGLWFITLHMPSTLAGRFMYWLDLDELGRFRIKTMQRCRIVDNCVCREHECPARKS
ncbi:phytoene dehydrogenase, chloroplastic/chromoplastic [Dorcoceras hygrometricum]|nr:phytoene dehydrogenase, chloroplastic/chromoplastic [Dorcoceras hygrometricum]